MKLDHVNIVVPDLKETVTFFEDVLDLHAGDRPPFPSTGAWMYGEGDAPAIVHLIEEAEDRKGPTGSIDHVAFRGSDPQKLRDKLDAHGLEYWSRDVPRTGELQVFFTAPFGVKIEVNFPASTA